MGLVIVPVVVVDREGRPVTDLQRDDFRVLEDGVEHQINSFEPVQAPCSVAVLLDASDSARGWLGEVKQAASQFVEGFRPEDRVMIVSFEGGVYVDSEWATDRTQLCRAILRVRPGLMTRLFDAIDLVIQERLQQVRGRKAIVLFGDGVDTHSCLSNSATTLALVEESNVVVYPVRFDTEGRWQPPVSGYGHPSPEELVRKRMAIKRESGESGYDQGARYLRQLAESSGGRYFNVQTPTDLGTALTAIAGELGGQYSLSYYPSPTASRGSFHRITVHVNRPEVSLRARRGYRLAPLPGAADTNLPVPKSP